MRAEIQSITFTSPKCFYCDNKWTHKLLVELQHPHGGLTGELIEVRTCDECRVTKTKQYSDRIREDVIVGSKQ